VGNVVESRWREALVGEHILRGVQQERSGVLETSFPCPPLGHTKSLPQNLRNPLDIQILTGIFRCEPRGDAGVQEAT
jgi:hypothetical protein